MMLFDEAFLRRLEHLSLIYRSAARSRMQGERRSQDRGGSVEFADFRPYTLGDDFRRIDWNAYARLEKLFIKMYQEEQQINLHLLIDNSLSMDLGSDSKLIYAQRLAAAIGYVGLLGLDRVRLMPLISPGNTAQPFLSFSGKRSVLQLFAACKSISTVPTSGSALEHVNASLSFTSRPGIFMVFTDLFDYSWQTALNRLLDRGHQLVLINILSPDEIDPQFEGEYRLLDSENGSFVELTSDFETLHAYRSHLANWQSEWAQFCSKRSAAYLPVSSRLPLEDLLFNQMQTAGVLK